MSTLTTQWDDAKDAWLIERLKGKPYINWSEVSKEFAQSFALCPVGRLMERWHYLKGWMKNGGRKAVWRCI